MPRLISRLFFLLIASTGLACADIVPMTKPQLVHALQEGEPCCVIDGRGEKSRKQRPLADAIVYRPGLEITPTAAVVVVADNDQSTKKIAGALDAAYPGKRILAVQGGLDTWEAALMAASQAAAATPGYSFVIPKNTCESGTPLQKLKSSLPKP